MSARQTIESKEAQAVVLPYMNNGIQGLDPQRVLVKSNNVGLLHIDPVLNLVQGNNNIFNLKISTVSNRMIKPQALINNISRMYVSRFYINTTWLPNVIHNLNDTLGVSIDGGVTFQYAQGTTTEQLNAGNIQAYLTSFFAQFTIATITATFNAINPIWGGPTISIQSSVPVVWDLTSGFISNGLSMWGFNPIYLPTGDSGEQFYAFPLFLLTKTIIVTSSILNNYNPNRSFSNNSANGNAIIATYSLDTTILDGNDLSAPLIKWNESGISTFDIILYDSAGNDMSYLVPVTYPNQVYWYMEISLEA
jgi:hypothetical protein